MKEDRSRDFDFFRDCPELKERLRERFLETALLSEEGLPLTDEELELVSAAGDPLCRTPWNGWKEQEALRKGGLTENDAERK